MGVLTWGFRRWAYRRGLRSRNDAVQFLALLVVGRAAFLRRNARVRGVYGREPVWMIMAGLFGVKDTVSWLTRKEAEYVTTERLQIGDRVQIAPVPPSRRRGRRAAS